MCSCTSPHEMALSTPALADQHGFSTFTPRGEERVVDELVLKLCEHVS